MKERHTRSAKTDNCPVSGQIKIGTKCKKYKQGKKRKQRRERRGKRPIERHRRQRKARIGDRRGGNPDPPRRNAKAGMNTAAKWLALVAAITGRN